MAAVESVLLTVVYIKSYAGDQPLSTATGFFFARDERLFLVSCRHVVKDEDSRHHPDRIVLELHNDADNLVETTDFSILLYCPDGSPLWKEGSDSQGTVDVVAIEIDQSALPESALYRAFTLAHLQRPSQRVEVGSSLMIVGFPLGFQDWLHHMAVARHAIVSSSFGLRFQGMGYFMTDARMHRGASGAPVLLSRKGDKSLGELPWKLLGVHSARLDVGHRDLVEDEALGLNCAWYADVLEVLTGAKTDKASA